MQRGAQSDSVPGELGWREGVVLCCSPQLSSLKSHPLARLYAAATGGPLKKGAFNQNFEKMPPTAPRIRLLFSLSAALPFSENLGHPVFSWRASVPCGHLLGLLFRALGGRVEEVAEEDQGEPEEEGEAAEQGAVPGEDGGNGGVPPAQATSVPFQDRQPAVTEKPASKPPTIYKMQK